MAKRGPSSSYNPQCSADSRQIFAAGAIHIKLGDPFYIPVGPKRALAPLNWSARGRLLLRLSGDQACALRDGAALDPTASARAPPAGG